MSTKQRSELGMCPHWNSVRLLGSQRVMIATILFYRLIFYDTLLFGASEERRTFVGHFVFHRSI